MAIGYGEAAPKPEPRKRIKARVKREQRDKTAEVREYVFNREQHLCRCCRSRRAQSMHELVPRSLGGKVSKRNSVAVCGSMGNDLKFCHGLLQQLQVEWTGDESRAEGVLEFRARTQHAADRMRVPIHTWIVSGPTPQIRGAVDE